MGYRKRYNELASLVTQLCFVRRISFERDTKVTNAGTFTIQREDHTIGNAIRWCVSIATYCVAMWYSAQLLTCFCLSTVELWRTRMWSSPATKFLILWSIRCSSR